MLTINTNTTALIAQNNLGGIQKAMQNSMKKLSTGKRINSAGDDAAGMQITNKMTTQIRGLDVAMRNANDAISMTQTAEGAMQEHTNIMNRMRDLALQSANDTNSLAEREAMQEEVNQLKTELDRIAETTEFSGKKLLDGSARDMTFQIGANANETISFSIAKMDSESLKGTSETELTKPQVNAILKFLNRNNRVKLSIDGKNIVLPGRAQDEPRITPKSLAHAISKNLKEAQEKTGSDQLNKDITVSALDGRRLIFYGDKGVKINVNSGFPFKLTTSETTIAQIDITSAIGAQKAIKSLDNSLAQVDKERASLGAIQNRLDATLSNLSNVQENMITSRSQIEDVDFAKEATNMTKNQMLMQAGSSILMQAKGLPQFALGLLG